MPGLGNSFYNSPKALKCITRYKTRYHSSFSELIHWLANILKITGMSLGRPDKKKKILPNDSVHDNVTV